MRHSTIVTALVLLALLGVGCAPGNERFAAATPAGFWWGLWHGCISFFTLVAGIFSDSVHLYETDNTGGWYDLGFVMGVGFAWGRGGTYTSRWRGKTREERAGAAQESE